MEDETGLAFISIKEVRNMLITEPMEVYCLISLDRQIVRTSANTITPGTPIEWFEGYTFDVTNNKSLLTVVLWNVSETHPSGRMLGQLSIPIVALKNAPEDIDRTSVIVSDEGIPTGIELVYRVQYSSLAGKKKVGFDDFVMLQFLGKGTFGKVMLVRKKDTNRLYAMKVMRKDKLYRESATAVPLIERDVLKRYNHPYVVHLKYAFQTETHLYMVMDYLNGGDLFDLMVARDVLDEDTTRFYAAQVVLAICFLHEHDIIYRDLKPENLLIDMNGNMCLVDFGLVKEGIFGDDITFTFCGSLQYMAPEVLTGEGYGKSVDWWALGVIIYEMLTGMHPFMQSRNGSFTEKEIIHSVVHDAVQFSSRFGFMSKAAIKLISGLLQKDPRRRMGSGPRGGEDIKNHPFFDGIDWKKLSRKELLPPFKPHLKDSLTDKKNPWSTGDSVTDSPAFHMLNEAEQECFQSFSYTSPTELSRTRSSPGFLLHLNNSNTSSPRASLSLSQSPRVLGRLSIANSPGGLASPRGKKMVRSPGFSGLSSVEDSIDNELMHIDEAEQEAEERTRVTTTIRRQRRRWSLSNFHVDSLNAKPDAESDTEGGNDDVGVLSGSAEFASTGDGKLKKSKGKSFLKSIFGKK